MGEPPIRRHLPTEVEMLVLQAARGAQLRLQRQQAVLRGSAAEIALTQSAAVGEAAVSAAHPNPTDPEKPGNAGAPPDPSMIRPAPDESMVRQAEVHPGLPPMARLMAAALQHERRAEALQREAPGFLGGQGIPGGQGSQGVEPLRRVSPAALQMSPGPQPGAAFGPATPGRAWLHQAPASAPVADISGPRWPPLTWPHSEPQSQPEPQSHPPAPGQRPGQHERPAPEGPMGTPGPSAGFSPARMPAAAPGPGAPLRPGPSTAFPAAQAGAPFGPHPAAPFGPQPASPGAMTPPTLPSQSTIPTQLTHPTIPTQLTPGAAPAPAGYHESELLAEDQLRERLAAILRADALRHGLDLKER